MVTAVAVELLVVGVGSFEVISRDWIENEREKKRVGRDENR